MAGSPRRHFSFALLKQRATASAIPGHQNSESNPAHCHQGEHMPRPLSQWQTNHPHSASNKPIQKSMKQESNDQHQSMATATPEAEEPVSLKSAAAAFKLKEVTLRSWCKKKLIKWKRVKIGNKPRRLVLISDVRAYLAKRPPSAIGRVESSQAMPQLAPLSMEAKVPVPKMPVADASSEAPLPAPVPNCAGHVESSQSTPEINSTPPSLGMAADVPQSTVAAKPAPSHPPASLKQKTKPPRVGESGLLMHRAKNSMRKFGADELRKIGAWITQRLANKFAPNNNPTPSEHPTPAS